MYEMQSRLPSLLVRGVSGWHREDFDVFENNCREVIADGCLCGVLKFSGSGGEELGSCLSTEDVDGKVTSVDHRPTVVSPAL